MLGAVVPGATVRARSDSRRRARLAVKLQSPTRKSVLSILKTGRDQRPPVTPEQLDLPEHANVRGPKYYH